MRVPGENRPSRGKPGLLGVPSPRISPTGQPAISPTSRRRCQDEVPNWPQRVAQTGPEHRSSRDPGNTPALSEEREPTGGPRLPRGYRGVALSDPPGAGLPPRCWCAVPSPPPWRKFGRRCCPLHKHRGMETHLPSDGGRKCHSPFY
jgi:hypothetical protein